jgi:hypothetical protein
VKKPTNTLTEKETSHFLKAVTEVDISLFFCSPYYTLLITSGEEQEKNREEVTTATTTTTAEKKNVTWS